MKIELLESAFHAGAREEADCQIVISRHRTISGMLRALRRDPCGRGPQGCKCGGWRLRIDGQWLDPVDYFDAQQMDWAMARLERR